MPHLADHEFAPQRAWPFASRVLLTLGVMLMLIATFGIGAGDRGFETLAQARSHMQKERLRVWLGGAAFLLIVTPTVADWAAKRLRARRARRNCCPACGYDLRASPERCPECGADSPRASL